MLENCSARTPIETRHGPVELRHLDWKMYGFVNFSLFVNQTTFRLTSDLFAHLKGERALDLGVPKR